MTEASEPIEHLDDVETDGDAQDDAATALFQRLPDQAARDELFAMYQPLVEYLARRFRSRAEPLDDLVQVAGIGLIKAIDRFDLERGVKFSTYAVPTIIGELKRHFRDTGWALRVPRRLQERSLLVRSIVSDLNQDLGRSPTIAEIAQRADLTSEEVLEAMEAVHAHSVESLDAPYEDDEDNNQLRSLGAEDETLELLEGWANVGPLLRELPERDRALLYYRFVCSMPQSQIAEKLGISQMHVSRLLARTVKTLRERVGET